jgi:hypothetical protein
MKGFDNLEMFFKRNFIKDNGYCIISTRRLTYSISLFSWQKFLFEQYYDYRSNQITCIRLATYKDFGKYLKEISLSSLTPAKG